MKDKEKRYRFIGDPRTYNSDIGYKVFKGAVLKVNTIPKKWDYSIQHMVEQYPEDWELAFDPTLLESAQELLIEIERHKEKTFPSLSNNLADKYLKQRLELIEKSLGIKAKEYVRNEDRMWNFNQAAIKSGKIREEALAGFRLKHEISIEDIREDIKNDILPTKEIVLEKFGDVINYFILEEMSILHRIENKKI